MENKRLSIKKRNGELIAGNVLIASKLLERMKGLMFSLELPSCDGLLIKQCNSIHTFFMLYPIDIIFLDKDFKVIRTIYNISPWKMTWVYLKASQVLEMKAGTLSTNISEGDVLEVVCLN